MTSLNDLNDDPTLLDSLSDKQLAKLHEEAESSDTPLAGTIRQSLNAAALRNVDSKDEEEPKKEETKSR